MVEALIFFNLITRQPVDPAHYLNCDQSNWMIGRIARSELLNFDQKKDFINRTIEGTDPSCFDY
jgi:hypothetical protein